ncbi:MAG TPA: DJ-1/PfpI/YhbO family deglycase/protease [Atribacteraceae bacterium]|nr:DJ-1/PfpI/YhbO family deglycase/protease [Atribacteraceae bacterium]
MKHRRVMIFVENLYQELSLWYPFLRFQEERIEVRLVGTVDREVFTGKHGYPAHPEFIASSVNTRDYDGAIIPGGFAPDYLRRYPAVINLLRELFEQGKLIGAVGHAPWVLASAEIVRGKRITGSSSIRDDIVNAGAEYVEERVITDGNLITAQGPEDLPTFVREALSFLWKRKPRLNTPAPDGWIQDVNANNGRLLDITAGRPSLVFFYDSIFSPRSVSALPRLSELAQAISSRGGVFMGVSADSFFTNAEYLSKHKLSFPLFSDVSREITKAFGVMGKHELPEWSVFLIDRNRILRYAENCPSGDFNSLPGFKKQLDDVLS